MHKSYTTKNAMIYKTLKILHQDIFINILSFHVFMYLFLFESCVSIQLSVHLSPFADPDP